MEDPFDGAKPERKWDKAKSEAKEAKERAKAKARSVRVKNPLHRTSSGGASPNRDGKTTATKTTTGGLAQSAREKAEAKMKGFLGGSSASSVPRDKTAPKKEGDNSGAVDAPKPAFVRFLSDMSSGSDSNGGGGVDARPNMNDSAVFDSMGVSALTFNERSESDATLTFIGLDDDGDAGGRAESIGSLRGLDEVSDSDEFSESAEELSRPMYESPLLFGGKSFKKRGGKGGPRGMRLMPITSGAVLDLEDKMGGGKVGGARLMPLKLTPIVSGAIFDENADDDDRSVGSLRSVDSWRSVGSAASVGSVRSIFSSRIEAASRRGAERADEASEGGEWSRRRRNSGTTNKKKKKKKKRGANHSEMIRDAIMTGRSFKSIGTDDVVLKMEERGEDPIMALPTTTELLTVKDFRIAPRADESYAADDASVDVTVATMKRKDKGYLHETARTKFEKGLKCVTEKKYALARSKFRASLKTYVLLHKDVHHVSISPVQEMMGHVERELGDHEKSQLHLLAALEICERALEKLEDEAENLLFDEADKGGPDGEDNGGGDEMKKEKEEQGEKESEEKFFIVEGMEQLGLTGSPQDEIQSHNTNASKNRRDEQWEILFINIGRIKKTIEVFKAEAAMQSELQVLRETINCVTIKDDISEGAASKDTKPRPKKSEAILRMEALMKQRENVGDIPTQEGDDSKDILTQEDDASKGTKSRPKKSEAILKMERLMKQREYHTALHPKEKDRLSTVKVGAQENRESKMRLGGRRMSFRNADRLRTRYYAQVDKGEELYGEGKYAEAIPCFNDAKFALLIIAGRPENDARLEDPAEAMYAKLRDEINSALLSERITDCHVQDFTSMSQVNYRQPAVMVTETKKLILKQMEEVANAAEEGTNDQEFEDLKELMYTANVALARIFSKQGSVHAKVHNHLVALDLFHDSIAAWEEAANIAQLEDRRAGTDFCANISGSNDDLLLLETHKMLGSQYESNSNSSHRNEALKNTTDLKALLVALQMASSHNARGEEAAEGGTSDDFKVAINHYLEALEIIRLTRCLRAASKIFSMDKISRLTTQGRALTALMAESETKDLVQNLGQFMKRCTRLKARQQLCISHACLKLGHQNLSSKWLSEAVASMDDLHTPDAKRESEAATYIFNMMGDAGVFGKERRLSNSSLYKLALPAFTDSCEEKPGLLLHTAMATLEKGLSVEAMDIFEQAMVLMTSPDRLYRNDLLHAMNAQIIIQLKEGNKDKALRIMNNRIDIISEWIGSSSSALAKDLHRLACLHSALGGHEQCAKILGESLRIGSDHDEYDALDSSKLLATTYDALNKTGNAISEYEFALGMEKDLTKKARLMNAVANQHIKVGRQSKAIDLLDQSLKMQNDTSNGKGKDADLIPETMILYGSAMASKNDFTQAIHWYESALNSNPDKSLLQKSNLRAVYNKGVILFRSGDTIGAGRVFGTILDEVDKNSEMAPGTGFVLNAIGSIHFSNKNYAGACEQFTKSLSLKNDDLSPYHRAMTLCNIGIAHHKMRNYEESDRNFNEALSIQADVNGGLNQATLAAVKCKFACILYTRKLYLRAYNMFREAASLGSVEASDFVDQCGSYAESSRLNLMKAERPPARTENISAHKPRVGANLFSITDGRNNALCSYGDAVYSQKRKILAALGVELFDCDSIEEPSEDTKILCNRALEYLLKQTEDSRVTYASDFERLVAEKLNSKFLSMKSLLSNYE